MEFGNPMTSPEIKNKVDYDGRTKSEKTQVNKTQTNSTCIHIQSLANGLTDAKNVEFNCIFD